MRRVRIHAAAAEEAAQAAAWYERERPGLGVDFERAVDAALRDAALYELLALVAAALGDLRQQVTFVGGCATALQESGGAPA